MSGRKLTLYKLNLLSSGDMSGNLTSSVLSLPMLDNVGIQIDVATGSPTGEFFVDVSANHQEENGNVTNEGTWVALDLPTAAAVTAGSPTSIYIDLNQLSALYLRVRYVRSSGTGTCNVVAVGKML